MLVAILRELTEYRNIVVTLYDENHFEDELICDKIICLKAGHTLSYPITAIKLNKVIKKYNPDLVHTHLFWPTIIARMATPKNIPLLTTIHSFIATSLEYKHRHVKWIDKMTYRLHKNIIIAVARGALFEYFSFLNLKPFKA